MAALCRPSLTFRLHSHLTYHYENTPMQYTAAIFHGCKNVHFQMNFLNIFLIFAQNIDCGYTLEPPQLIEAVLTSTHNLCFGAKIRKKVYPCKTQFYYIKVGCKGVFVTRTCFRDVKTWLSYLFSHTPGCCRNRSCNTGHKL